MKENMNVNGLNKKLSEMLGKMDEKVLQAKLNHAMEMLKKGDMDDLVKKIKKMDKNELVNKMNEMDDTKLKELSINKEEIKQKVSEEELNNLAKLIGDHGDEIINKIKDIIK